MQPDLTDRDNDSDETRPATMVRMPKNPPESMQHHLRVRLNEHAKTRWPALKRVEVRFRAGFAYVDGIETDGYEDNFLPSGRPSGSPEEALDCACGLYLGDPTAWITKPSTD